MARDESDGSGAQWLADPTAVFDERYWDGSGWTDRVRVGDAEGRSEPTAAPQRAEATRDLLTRQTSSPGSDQYGYGPSDQADGSQDVEETGAESKAVAADTATTMPPSPNDQTEGETERKLWATRLAFGVAALLLFGTVSVVAIAVIGEEDDDGDDGDGEVESVDVDFTPTTLVNARARELLNEAWWQTSQDQRLLFCEEVDTFGVRAMYEEHLEEAGNYVVRYQDYADFARRVCDWKLRE